ncbi:alpha/beta fold hydrolase [Amycolatopsis decaplanina]|uniref:Virginiamycin B lyase n=1 Tax=Amycolatopsis decaplanina DSM 44594 TaxID=1284240 RepID=M2Y218_9PSEU|nr:alpha/beta fold hydrolase [Amycolatopsis decaplanina]EME55585.1 Virginiamycin B lyase [Amycolatopsis decaplanina DSM 44594]
MTFTIVYAHGGGFTSYDPEIGRLRDDALQRATKLQVVTVEYRLAPEHRYPAQVDDVLDVYRSIEGPVVLLGESAGGTIVLSALLRLLITGEPLPAGVAAISPIADLTLPGGSFVTNDGADIVSRDALRRSVEAYLGGGEAGPASPSQGDFTGSPPLWLAVGTAEVLHDDVVTLATSARGSGVTTELRAYEGAQHGFQFSGEYPIDTDLAGWIEALG